MIIGEGRSVTIAVVVTAFVLFLLLIVTIVMGIEEYGPKLWGALGGRVAPPPDRALAGRKASGNPAIWFGNDAYPLDAIRRSEQGRTVAELRLDAAGWPTRCDIATSSGSASLDATTCAILMKHARFAPARDPDGVATAGTFTVPVRWVLPQYPAGHPPVQ